MYIHLMYTCSITLYCMYIQWAYNLRYPAKQKCMHLYRHSCVCSSVHTCNSTAWWFNGAKYSSNPIIPELISQLPPQYVYILTPAHNRKSDYCLDCFLFAPSIFHLVRPSSVFVFTLHLLISPIDWWWASVNGLPSTARQSYVWYDSN